MRSVDPEGYSKPLQNKIPFFTALMLNKFFLDLLSRSSVFELFYLGQIYFVFSKRSGPKWNRYTLKKEDMPNVLRHSKRLGGPHSKCCRS